MSAVTYSWKIHPHGRLTQVESNILTVTGTILMPAGRLPRRMTVVKLANDELVIFSAMALADDQMTVLQDSPDEADRSTVHAAVESCPVQALTLLG